MTDRSARIAARLRERLAAQDVEIVDESAAHAGHAGARGGAGHFAVTVVSPRFAGLGTLARHRLVYEALAELTQTDIHALRIRALTPDER